MCRFDVNPKYERFLIIVKIGFEWKYIAKLVSYQQFGQVYDNLFMLPNITTINNNLVY